MRESGMDSDLEDEERQYCQLLRYCEKIDELEKRNEGQVINK